MTVKAELLEQINAINGKDIFLQQVYELVMLSNNSEATHTTSVEFKGSLDAARKQIDEGQHTTVEEFKEKYSKWC